MRVRRRFGGDRSPCFGSTTNTPLEPTPPPNLPGGWLADDLGVMEADATEIMNECTGAEGVVFGALTADGEVDTAALDRIGAAAGPGVPITFHRAIDMTRDYIAAVEAAANHPAVDRILTSGAAASCLDGIGGIVGSGRVGRGE